MSAYRIVMDEERFFAVNVVLLLELASGEF